VISAATISPYGGGFADLDPWLREIVIERQAPFDGT
jgi:hypothetical protein